MKTVELCKVEIVSETETEIMGAIHNVKLSVVADIIWQGINHLKKEIEATAPDRKQFLQHQIDYCTMVHDAILKESANLLKTES